MIESGRRRAAIWLPSAPLFERQPAATQAEDQMIEQTLSEYLPRLCHPSSEFQIFCARRWISTWMSVKQNKARSVPKEPLLEDRARFDCGPRQRASKELPLGEQPVPRIEEKRAHYLLVTARISQGQIARHSAGMIQRFTLWKPGPGQPPSEFHGREQTGGLRRPHSTKSKLTSAHAAQPHETSALAQKSSSQVESRRALSSGTEQDGHDLSVRQDRWASR